MKQLIAKLLETTPYEHRVAIVNAMLYTESSGSFEQELIDQTGDYPELPVEDIMTQYRALGGK